MEWNEVGARAPRLAGGVIVCDGRVVIVGGGCVGVVIVGDGVCVCVCVTCVYVVRYFLVGAGAIGCEMLKNWALMGVGAGAASDGDGDGAAARKARGNNGGRRRRRRRRRCDPHRVADAEDRYSRRITVTRGGRTVTRHTSLRTTGDLLLPTDRFSSDGPFLGGARRVASRARARARSRALARVRRDRCLSPRASRSP